MSYRACVIGNLSRVDSTYTIGAIWDSKNLKAIAVPRNQGVSIAQPEEFIDICNKLVKRTKSCWTAHIEWVKSLVRYNWMITMLFC